MNKINRIFISVRNHLPVKQTRAFILRRPFTSFLVTLAALLLVIILANSIGNAPQVKSKQPVVAKDVQIYNPGGNATITLQATIEKSGIAKIIAQTAGIVQSINVSEGSSVNQGTTLVNLSSNYQGGNAAGVQQELSQAQYQNTLDTYQTQKDLISKQRDLANATSDNTEQLRQISQQSLNDTNSLLTQNQNILNTISTNIQTLQNSNTNGSNDAAIQQAQQAQAQEQSAVNQLQQTSRTLSYQVNTSNAPTTLANVQKDIALKQLDVQDKALDLGKTTANLQVQLASINVGMMYPVSPFAGTVQRVMVHVGDAVNPGTPLVTIAGNSQTAKAIVSVPAGIAGSVSRLTESTLTIGNTSVYVKPSFISTDATNGSLYTVIYAIPDTYTSGVTDGDEVNVSIPLIQPEAAAQAMSASNDPFIPLDSVYQTTDSAYVYIVKNNHAESMKVTLGEVYGGFVAVTGVSTNDKIILNRNIVDGEAVRVQ